MQPRRDNALFSANFIAHMLVIVFSIVVVWSCINKKRDAAAEKKRYCSSVLYNFYCHCHCHCHCNCVCVFNCHRIKYGVASTRRCIQKHNALFCATFIARVMLRDNKYVRIYQTNTILRSITNILKQIFLAYYTINLILVRSPEVPSLSRMATFQITFHLLFFGSHK